MAVSAYAAHAAEGAGRERLMLAAMFAFGHGVALAALAPGASTWPARIALSAILTGMLLFSGSLAGSVLAGFPTALAPFGGSLMIMGWLLLAVDALRR